MIMRLAWILFGVVFMIITFRAYFRQRMTDTFALGWLSISLAVIIAGVLIRKEWQEALPLSLLILLAVVMIVLFGISLSVSGLVMRNRELAMQVSLLNQENEQVLRILGILSKDSEKDESKDESKEETVIRD